MNFSYFSDVGVLFEGFKTVKSAIRLCILAMSLALSVLSVTIHFCFRILKSFKKPLVLLVCRLSQIKSILFSVIRG